MSVNSVSNTTPAYNKQLIKKDEQKFEEIAAKAMAVSDTFNYTNGEENDKKSLLGSTASILMAVGISYIGGAMFAGKVSEAFNPQTIEKLNGIISKGAGKVASKIAKPLAKNSSKLLNNVAEKLPQIAQKVNYKHVVGLASASVFVPKLTTVDGNNDGIKDITQKNVNAYKNAFQGLGAIADLLSTIG